MEQAKIEVGKEYFFTKSKRKVKIKRLMFDNVYEAKKMESFGTMMVVSSDFLEEIPTTEELIESGVKKRRGRPSKPKTTSLVEHKIKRPRGRPKKIVS